MDTCKHLLTCQRAGGGAATVQRIGHGHSAVLSQQFVCQWLAGMGQWAVRATQYTKGSMPRRLGFEPRGSAGVQVYAQRQVSAPETNASSVPVKTSSRMRSCGCILGKESLGQLHQGLV